VAVVCGEYDEIIARSHTVSLAANIQGARMVIEPAVSHFAMLQDPARFSDDVLAFLRG
jgi:pimeloyl-ACP methyl ester carboxylesterase